MTINIECLKPLMKPGYVAMDETGFWAWYSAKPTLIEDVGCWNIDPVEHPWYNLKAFDIKPADDWKTSLQECGL